MYICDRCGDLVDDIPTHTEYEEYWGRNISVEIPECCDCGGAYVEVGTCACCGGCKADEPNYSKSLVEKFEKLNLEGTDYDYDVNDMCIECINEAIKTLGE